MGGMRWWFLLKKISRNLEFIKKVYIKIHRQLKRKFFKFEKYYWGTKLIPNHLERVKHYFIK
jgi:hypothetical protein